MKTLEVNSPIGNATALPVEVIRPLVALILGPHDREVQFGRGPMDRSMYWNGVLFVRVMFPFWIGVMVRWSGKNPNAKEYLHIGLGWKLNGRLGAHLRVLSDRSSSAGVAGPNYGQAYGWGAGPK